MKKLFTALTILLALGIAMPAMADGETRQVCVDVKDKDGKTVTDPKTGKPKQNCREVKAHQKLEGNKVPDKK